AELATRARDADGAYRQGPEILLWGTARPVDGPYGPYYGVSQALIDELYGTCRDPDGRELCPRRARALLLDRGVAHGLSHPFDGHALSLEGTFAIISEFTHIESLNGGYFAPSTRVLDAYIALHNALVAGALLADDLLTPVGRRLVQHIRSRGRRLFRLGGSDAHNHDFDRVVTSFALPPGHTPHTVRPGDLCAALLAEEEEAAVLGTPPDRLAPEHHALAATPHLCQLGNPASHARQLIDIIAIIVRNFWHNALHFRPVTFVKAVKVCTETTMNELRIRASQQAMRTRALAVDFDPAALLPLLRTTDSHAVARPRSASGIRAGSG
ncbi:MAG: hypothetical protein WCG85_03305, partial [Polyangia bacterium]